MHKTQKIQIVHKKKYKLSSTVKFRIYAIFLQPQSKGRQVGWERKTAVKHKYAFIGKCSRRPVQLQANPTLLQLVS